MIGTSCSICYQIYPRKNPQKKITTISQCICNTCLSNILKSKIDHKYIDGIKYTSNPLQINNEMLKIIQKQIHLSEISLIKNYKQKQSNSIKKQFQICLLHSKSADLICCLDGNFICSNCALFGQHKGHTVKKYDQFLNLLTTYTEQALQIFDKLKQKQSQVNQQVITTYIDDCFQEKKDKQIKNIKIGFTKLIQRIKKIEKSTILRLDNEIKIRKEKLGKEISIKQIQDKKKQWFVEVQKLGNTTQNAYLYKDIVESLKYFDERALQSFLVKKGEYLYLQYCSLQNVIKNKIDSECIKLMVTFPQNINKTLEECCQFNSDGICQKNQIINRQKCQQSYQYKTEKNKDDDFLIDQVIGKSQLIITPFNQRDIIEQQREKAKENNCDAKLSEISLIESVRPLTSIRQREIRSEKAVKTVRKKLNSTVGSSTTLHHREVLGPVENKKRKKVQIPQKYRQIFQDLKYDRCEMIDFGGAELGDQTVLYLCEFIERSRKVRNIKLFRNRISDEVVKYILNACSYSKIMSINLGNNNLTQKTLEILDNFNFKQLKYINLSINKINRRNVKNKIDGFGKKGLVVSI